MRKFQRNEPYYAANWILKKLVPSELLKKINVSVYIRAMKHQKGQCWAYEKSPNEYTIVISASLGRRDALRAIAHEAVHVMQYATGKMKDIYGNRDKKVIWKNKMLPLVDKGSAYYNSPWEKEAYDKQEGLSQAYLEHVAKMIT